MFAGIQGWYSIWLVCVMLTIIEVLLAFCFLDLIFVDCMVCLLTLVID